MSSQGFDSLVDQLLANNHRTRVLKFEYSGRFYWLKQKERLTGAMRIIKPCPTKALKLEIETLIDLADQGAPVPALICSSSHYLVLTDVGKTLKDWLLDPHISQETKQTILNDSADALAQLHSMGLSHGRPALRDISWKAGKVSFIDFEATQINKPLVEQQRRDLLVFIHSLYRYIGPKQELILPVISTYCESGGEDIWLATKKWLAPWQWLYHGLRPLRDIGGKDLRPIYWLLWHFRQSH